jgi:hypothetical protein
MADVLTINGIEFKRRNPIGVWLLGLVTVAIYYVVWFYKINKEAKNYLGDEALKPWLSAVAVSPLGWILLFIPPLVSTYRAGQRIAKMQQKAGLVDQISPGICLLLFLVSRVDMIYMQEHLNRIWKRYLPAAQAQGPGPGTQPQAGVPAPPPATGSTS